MAMVLVSAKVLLKLTSQVQLTLSNDEILDTSEYRYLYFQVHALARSHPLR